MKDSIPTVLALYEKLKPKIGEEEARALLEFVEASVERKAATKEDLQRMELALREEIRKFAQASHEEIQQVNHSLREEIRKFAQASHEEIQQVNHSLREEIHRVDQSLREEIHKLDQKIEATKADLIKWMFGFWIGNVAVLSGIIFALLRVFARQ
jgi:hypothetical protein